MDLGKPKSEAFQLVLNGLFLILNLRDDTI